MINMKYAHFNTESQLVISWLDTDSFVYGQLPPNSELIQITDDQYAERNEQPWYVVAGILSATAPIPTADQVAAQASAAIIESAQAALVAGLSIESASNPTLNAVYAVDALSQMDIIAIETSLNAGKGFPGGASAFKYQDASGVMHVFSVENFTGFAAAVRDYVYALKSVIAGASTRLPTASATIA